MVLFSANFASASSVHKVQVVFLCTLTNKWSSGRRSRISTLRAQKKHAMNQLPGNFMVVYGSALGV